MNIPHKVGRSNINIKDKILLGFNKDYISLSIVFD